MCQGIEENASFNRSAPDARRSISAFCIRRAVQRRIRQALALTVSEGSGSDVVSRIFNLRQAVKDIGDADRDQRLRVGSVIALRPRQRRNALPGVGNGGGGSFAAAA